MEVTVSLPERRYDLAGELLAAAIEQSTHSGKPVHDVLPPMARNAGREISAATSSLPAAPHDHGFEPRPDDSDGWVLGNCPFHQLTRRHTELICGLNLELLRGIAEGTEDTRYTMVLDSAPDRCCVRVTQALTKSYTPLHNSLVCRPPRRRDRQARRCCSRTPDVATLGTKPGRGTPASAAVDRLRAHWRAR